MIKLSKNAERVWKIIAQFPHGKATYKDVMRITGLRKSKVYDCLNELEVKGFIEHKKPYWILKGRQKESLISKIGKVSSTPISFEPEIPEKERIALMETIAERYGYSWLKDYVKKLKKLNKT